MINRKNILLLVAVFGSVLVLARIPFEWIYMSVFDADISEHLKILTVCSLVIMGSYLLATRNDFLSEGGFRKHQKYNYWMLALPLLFPGILYLSNLRNGCMFNSGLLISIVVISRAMMEEALFRGVIQGFLIKNYPNRSYFRICVLTAGIFAFAHFVAIRVAPLPYVLNQVIYAFFCGMLFSALLFRTGNVWALGLVHGILNLLSRPCTRTLEVDEKLTAGEFAGNLALLILVLSPLLLLSWVLVKKPVNQLRFYK